MTQKTLLFVAMCMGAALSLSAAGNVLYVRTNKVEAPIHPIMYGHFFEDINYAADGMLSNSVYTYSTTLEPKNYYI